MMAGLVPPQKHVTGVQHLQDSRTIPIAVVNKENLLGLALAQTSAETSAFGVVQLLNQKPLHCIKLEDLGDIQVPVSLSDTNRLKLVKKSKIISTIPSENFCLPSHVVNLFQLPRGELMDIELKLDGLILYETDGRWKNIKSLDSAQEAGVIGTVVLQLPVEGGHDGGRLEMKYKGKTKIYENCENSNRNYFVSAYYKGCHYAVQHVTRGVKLTLVYSVVWKNAKVTPIPQDFQAFIASYKHLQKALTPWIPSLGESEENAPSVDPLFFVLQEKYEEKDLSFHRLGGQDLYLAHLLRCSRFIDVHLAMVTHTVTESLASSGQTIEKHCTEISHWIDSNNFKMKLNVELDWEKQCVGSIRNLLQPNEVQPEETLPFCNRGCVTPIDGKHYHHSVLVIWPKSQTLKMYCRHGLRSSLDISCEPLIEFMSRVLPLLNLRAPSATDNNIVIDMLTCFVRLGNVEGLQLLISKVTSHPVSNDLLENIISSPVILELVTSSDIGKSTVASLVDAYLTLMSDQLSAEQQPQLESLSSCLGLVMLLERNNSVPESQRLSTIEPLLTKLNGRQFEYLLTDMLKRPNTQTFQSLKQRPCSVYIIDLVCNVLLFNFNDIFMTKDGFSEAVRCLIQLQNDSLTMRQLLERIFWTIRVYSRDDLDCSLFIDIITSLDIWGKLNVPLKLIILNGCADAIQIGILNFFKSLKPNSPPIVFEKLPILFNLFLLSEKNRVCPEQTATADSFRRLFPKLSSLSILNLLIEVHQSESKAHPSIKDVPVCFDVYRELCRGFFSRDFVPILNSNVNAKTNVTDLIFWLEDEESRRSYMLAYENDNPNSRGVPMERRCTGAMLEPLTSTPMNPPVGQQLPISNLYPNIENIESTY